MDIKKSVFERLFTNEVNLSSQKYEFAIVDDFAKSLADAKQVYGSLNSSVASADNLKKQLADVQAKFDQQVVLIKKTYAAAEKNDAASSKLYDKAKLLAGDLGLKIEDIKGYKEWFDSTIAINSAINSANKYLS